MFKLEAAVKEAGLMIRKLKNPCQTWWDSQYDNMESIHPYKDAITRLALNNPDWEGRGFMASHWKLLEGACTILKPTKETNKALQCDKEPIL